MTDLRIDPFEQALSRHSADQPLTPADMAEAKRNLAGLQLAEAMLPSLNYLEVGLRNGVNRLVGGIYSPDWLITLPIQIQFSEDDLSQIARIKADVLKYKGKLASHDDVLAQLNFGFWVALFHKRHMGGIWSRAREPLASTFPHMPASYWGGEELRERRQQVKNLLDSVKALRNRIAHHEPIWKQTPTALDVHQNCIDLIRALTSHPLYALLSIIATVGGVSWIFKIWG